MLDRLRVLALLFDVNWKRQPNFIDETQGGDPHLRSVLRVIICLSDAFLNQLAEQISFWKLLRILYGQKWKQEGDGIEILNKVRIKPLEGVHVDPCHLVSSTSEISYSRDKVFSHFGVPLQSVVDRIYTVILALEPPHRKLYQLNIAAEVLRYAR